MAAILDLVATVDIEGPWPSKPVRDAVDAVHALGRTQWTDDGDERNRETGATPCA